ncbi:unnamed protein product [Peronospora belbahrii]|uniref:AGC-kinase C-terminal domain-containing protein n=1 Tax=Peronospora belbahrii TaxID=622444 RepID=A0AAU9KLK4_9STRA|nr:unnamed protein product [Peronospora belbahrii]
MSYSTVNTLSTMNASTESDVDLMRTILGEHVPQSVILTCLNACAFDVSAALNWYFAEVASSPASTAPMEATEMTSSPTVTIIQSGLSLTLHSRAMEGMVSKTEAYYATLTKGDPAYDMLTPSNEKFLTIRLRKRGWRTGKLLEMVSPFTQRPGFVNGDVVTLECNGLWLKVNSINKMLQWKAPSEDDRNKFVIRGLPLGKNLAPGDYFFLTSYKWKDKEIVCKDERPVGISSYNTNVHRCFLGLERIKTANQRLYLYGKLTRNAVKSLPKPDDPIDVDHLTISVMGTPMSTAGISLRDQSHLLRQKSSISDEIHLTNAKIEQMANIIGTDVSHDCLANFLDGAGGDVQVALEHYFMSVSTSESSSVSTHGATSASVPLITQIKTTKSAAALEEAQIRAHVEARETRDRCPRSQLILGIPSISEPVLSPSTKPLSITPPGVTAKATYDWWSLGVVIYEMLVGESPFYDENEHKMLSRIAYSDVVFPSEFPCDADIDWDKLLRREVKAHWTPKLSGETDTRYVDPEFIDEGPPSAAYDPSADSAISRLYGLLLPKHSASGLGLERSIQEQFRELQARLTGPLVIALTVQKIEKSRSHFLFDKQLVPIRCSSLPSAAALRTDVVARTFGSNVNV